MGTRETEPTPGGLLSGSVRNLTIRGALLVGFGLILTLWLASGLDVLRRLREVESRAVAVNARVTQAEEILSAIRGQVLLGSVYLRDALLDTPDTIESYRRQIDGTRSAMRQLLDRYEAVVDTPSERSTLTELRTEIDGFWENILPVLAWNSERRAAEARAILRSRITPKREAVIRISERIRQLNLAAFHEQQAEVARIHSVVRRRVWEATLGLMLIGGIAAFFVTRYAGRLERRILEDATNLHRLSAKLVRAQEEERRTIARELHDEIGQELTGVKVELAVAERSLDVQTRERDLLAEARRMTDRALQTVRDLSQLLHPPMLDDLGLPATLDWLLGGFGRRTAVAVDLHQDLGEERLAPEIEMCLYRIVQEATTNISRHAEARTCRVRLQRSGSTVQLTVQDDGRGFDPAQVLQPGAGGGLGLLGMRERVSGFGGRFLIESAVGRGTRIDVHLPAVGGTLPTPEPARNPEGVS